MPPKRKSAVLAVDIDLTVDEPEPAPGPGSAAKENVAVNVNVNAFATLMEPAAKKARVSDVGEGCSSGAKKGKAKAPPAAPKDWREVVLEGEDEVSPPSDIRALACRYVVIEC